MKKLRVIFMGTPVFAVPGLEELINHTNVVLVVTAPDAFVGRKRVLTACPVKEAALTHGIEVFSPAKIRADYEKIKELQPDIIITCAYGQILSEAILNIPRLGCVNIHASLLPKYRGGAPIHHAIMNGETETGITLFLMAPGMDDGDMLAKQAISISESDNLETLSSKLSSLGTKMLMDCLPVIIDGTVERIKQNHDEATFAPIVLRADEHLDFTKTKEEVYNHIRAFAPAPLTYFVLDGIEYKIASAHKSEQKGKISTVAGVSKAGIVIGTSNGSIVVTKLKPFGKKAMLVSDYLNGIKQETLLGKEVS